jgi:16S rRNA processing protein RimM
MAQEKLLEVARIGKAHGLQGEISVHLITNVVERLSIGSVLFLEDEREITVKFSKPYKQNFLVFFEGITSRSSAEQLVGKKLFATPIDDPDTIWVHEVIGSEVIDEAGEHRGKVVEVESNPASDLLVLDNGSLIPLTFVVDHKEKIVHVEVPDGLWDSGQ